MMASRFSGSVLLLFLINFGQQVIATRYGGRSIIPHSEQSEVSPRSYKPAASRYDGHVLPRSSLGSYRLAEKASPRSYSTLATASRQSGSYGRLGDGPAHEGSVSSYRPTSSWSPKPRETPQQPRKDGPAHQGSVSSYRPTSSWSPKPRETPQQPRKDGSAHQGSVSSYRPTSSWSSKPRETPQKDVLLSKTSMSANPSPQNRREFRSRIVSSGPVQEQQPSLKATARQQPGSPASTRLQVKVGVQDVAFGSKVQSPNRNGQLAAHPRSPRPVASSSFSKVQQPRSGTSGVHQSKGMRGTVPLSESRFSSGSTSDRVQAVYPTAKLVKQSSSGGLRGAASSSMMSPTLKKQPSTHPRSLPPTTSRSSSRVQLPSSGTTGVLKIKGMWDTPPAQIGNELRSVSVSNHRSGLSTTAKPPRRESSPSVSSKKDIKAAMWTGDFNPNVRPRSKPVPLASRYTHERQQPHLAAVSSRSRQPSAY